jgi:hypothetical protein
MIDLPQLTETPIPTEVAVASLPSVEPTASPPPRGFAFVVQQGSPSAIAWTTFHPDAGCDWTGVAGQATSLNGEAVKGLFVELGGADTGTDSSERIVMTGMNPEYGQGGFEFIISNSLYAAENTLWIQLFDQQMLPLSDRVYFNTFADCEKNLVIIYFDQVH